MILITATCRFDDCNADFIWQCGAILSCPNCGRLNCIQPVRISTQHEIQSSEVEVLTPREIEVLALVKIGFSNIEIANAFSISIRTVFKHVSSIIHKLGVSSRTGAVNRAEELGIILVCKNT